MIIYFIVVILLALICGKLFPVVPYNDGMMVTKMIVNQKTFDTISKLTGSDEKVYRGIPLFIHESVEDGEILAIKKRRDEPSFPTMSYLPY